MYLSKMAKINKLSLYHFLLYVFVTFLSKYSLGKQNEYAKISLTYSKSTNFPNTHKV